MTNVLTVDDVFQALAEPRRRAILAVLGQGERTVGDIAGRFDVTRPAISQHLRVLREAGLVAERADGRRRWYRVDPTGIERVRSELDRFWDHELDELQATAERSRG